MTNEIKTITFDENTPVEEKEEVLMRVAVDSGDTKPLVKDPQPTDKKAFYLTRDDCAGLAYMQTDRGRKFIDGKGKMMVTNHSVLMDLMSHALNRPIWNFEDLDEELEKVFFDCMENWNKRYGGDAPVNGENKRS